MIGANLFRGLVVSLLAGFVLGACMGSRAATGAPTAPPKTPVASTGFECPQPEPRMEITSTELNLLVWTQYLPLEMQECFQLVYGVTVNRDEYSSNEEMFPKLQSEQKAYDLVQPSDYMIAPVVREGLLQELDKARLPNLRNLDPTFMDLEFDPGNRYTIPFEAGTDALVYNARTVVEPPKSWADLWNPDYAGRMVFSDDARVVIGMALLTLGYDVNTTDPAQLEEAKAKLKSLIPAIKLFDSDTPSNVLISGDVEVGITWTGEAFLAHQGNVDIQYAYPAEGAVVWQDNWAIAKGAPHPDAAYAWLNYTMQGNLFWLMLRDFPYINPNRAALEYARENQPDLYHLYIESPITNPPAAVIQNGHRIDDVGEARGLYDQIWLDLRGE